MIENLDPFFSDFGLIAFSPSNNGGEFLVIFDEYHEPIELGTEGRRLIATTKTSNTIDLHHGDTLEIDGKTYTIVGIRPTMDGKITELDLKYA